MNFPEQTGRGEAVRGRPVGPPQGRLHARPDPRQRREEGTGRRGGGPGQALWHHHAVHQLPGGAGWPAAVVGPCPEAAASVRPVPCRSDWRRRGGRRQGGRLRQDRFSDGKDGTRRRRCPWQARERQDLDSQEGRRQGRSSPRQLAARGHARRPRTTAHTNSTAAEKPWHGKISTSVQAGALGVDLSVQSANLRNQNAT